MDSSGEEGGHSTHLTKLRFKVFSRKSYTKFDRYDGALSSTNIQSTRLTSFLLQETTVFF